MENELKPCPKCGGKLTTLERITALGGKYVRICELCGHWGPAQDTENAADAAWNQRPTPPAQDTAQSGEVSDEELLMQITSAIQRGDDAMDDWLEPEELAPLILPIFHAANRALQDKYIACCQDNVALSTLCGEKGLEIETLTERLRVAEAKNAVAGELALALGDVFGDDEALLDATWRAQADAALTAYKEMTDG